LADEGLIAFDRRTVWGWDIDRIHAKNYTDTWWTHGAETEAVADATQDALKHLACLGNMEDCSTILDQGERRGHARGLWEAVPPASSFSRVRSTQFLHDRISRRHIRYFLTSAVPIFTAYRP